MFQHVTKDAAKFKSNVSYINKVIFLFNDKKDTHIHQVTYLTQAYKYHSEAPQKKISVLNGHS